MKRLVYFFYLFLFRITFFGHLMQFQSKDSGQNSKYFVSIKIPVAL